MQLTQFSATQKPQIIEKEAKKSFPRKIFANTVHCYITIPKWLDFKSDSHRRRNFHFIFIGSEVTVQKRSRLPITWWPIASCHLTQRKKCDDFWLPGAESFSTTYSKNDFVTKFFSRYYTLNLFIIYITPSILMPKVQEVAGEKTRMRI